MSDGRFDSGRHAGVVVPLFSIPSHASWGIGEIPDLARFARWLSAAGLDFVQLLPVNEMADGQNSPYSAQSAMAIDPIYIALGEVEEFAAAGGEAALPAEDRAALDGARSASRVAYSTIRTLKSRALRAAFGRFQQHEWGTGSTRAAALREFITREGWWLDDYALFRALHHESGARHWIEWDPGLRGRDPAALDHARQRLAPDIRYRAWLQWIADGQWRRARRDSAPVGIFGDFPFVVSADSGDVWARQHEFRLDASVGTPPDAFSETGQDWGLPVYRWDVMAAGGHEWMRQRARRSAALYDGYRVDHLVGFYRTFVRERDGRTAFVPPDEPTQIAQGELLLRLIGDSGAKIIAEDLGLVPDFVRESLSRMHVPGFKVLRWERQWKVPGQPFRDPAAYPAISVATSGTHDTETLAEWWDTATAEERQSAVELPPLRAAGCRASDTFSETLRDALLEVLFASGSNFVLVPLQDIFGWRDRVNTPAIVDDINWTWRLPWAVDDLMSERQARNRAAFLRTLTRNH
jgi:4-alpha-glucanotransferase